MLKKEIFLDTPQSNLAFHGMAAMFMSRDLLQQLPPLAEAALVIQINSV